MMNPRWIIIQRCSSPPSILVPFSPLFWFNGAQLYRFFFFFFLHSPPSEVLISTLGGKSQKQKLSRHKQRNTELAG